MAYQRRDDYMAGADAALVTLLVLGLVALVVAFIVALTTEIARIYKARALQPTKTAWVLWLSAGFFLGACLIALILATTMDLVAPAVYLVAWSFLIFCVVIEAYDLYARYKEKRHPHENAAGLLEFTPVDPRWNGHGYSGVEDTLQEGVILGEPVS